MIGTAIEGAHVKMPWGCYKTKGDLMVRRLRAQKMDTAAEGAVCNDEREAATSVYVVFVSCERAAGNGCGLF